MMLKTRPLLEAENHDRDFAAHQILLVAHVLVRRQQHVKAVRFRGHEQFAILEPVPSFLRSVRTSWPLR
jgi:hypothetical protein